MTFKDVIAIISLAMKNEYDINVNGGLMVDIFKNEDEWIELRLNNLKTLYVETSNEGKLLIKDLTEAEILQYKLMIEDLKKYSESKCISFINNFFPKEPAKTNINDLDDEN